MSSAFDCLSDPEYIDAICFDMDGVLADLYNEDGWEEQLNNYLTAPYMNAQPLLDTERLDDLIASFDEWFSIPTYIISWGSMYSDLVYDKQVEKAKKYWLEQYLPSIDHSNVFVVPYGTSKAAVIRDLCNNPVLFDDTRENCEEWDWNTVHVDTRYSDEIIISTLEDLFYCIDGACA